MGKEVLPDALGVNNETNDRINPATAEAQQQLLDALAVLLPNVYPNQHQQGTTPADTQPVSAASLPLPSGAATSANQLPDNHQVSVSNQPTNFPDVGTHTRLNLIEDAINNLLVAQGYRISQVLNRAHHEVAQLNLLASQSLYTVPDGFVLHALSVKMGAINSNTSSGGRATITDGLGGALKDALDIEEASAGIGGISKASSIPAEHSEPLLFTDSVYYNQVSGTLDAYVILVGYLEPV